MDICFRASVILKIGIAADGVAVRGVPGTGVALAEILVELAVGFFFRRLGTVACRK